MGSLARVLLFGVLVTAACGGDDDPTGPSRAPADDPAPFDPSGPYELALAALNPSNGCTSDDAIVVPPGFPDLPVSGLHVLDVVLRREGEGWVAVPVAPGESLRLRMVLDQWPASPAFTGTLEGKSTQGSVSSAPLGTSVAIEGGAAVEGLAIAGVQLGIAGPAAVGTATGTLVFGSRNRTVACTSAQLILRTPR